MKQVSDPALVLTRHQRYGAHACLCGWTDYHHTHADHVLEELANGGFVVVSVAALVDALGVLGFDVSTLRVPYPEQAPTRVGGVSEVATECGVGKSTASMWMTKADRLGFPAPWRRLAAGNIYDLDAVKRWHDLFVATRNGNGAHA